MLDTFFIMFRTPSDGCFQYTGIKDVFLLPFRINCTIFTRTYITEIGNGFQILPKETFQGTILLSRIPQLFTPVFGQGIIGNQNFVALPFPFTGTMNAVCFLSVSPKPLLQRFPRREEVRYQFFLRHHYHVIPFVRHIVFCFIHYQNVPGSGFEPLTISPELPVSIVLPD